MQNIHLTLDTWYLTGTRSPYTDASQAAATAAIDVWRAPIASVLAHVHGATGSSGTWALEGSSEVPPPGVEISARQSSGWAGDPWQPSEASWVSLASASSNGNDVYTTLAPTGAFTGTRFIRVRWTPDAGTGGTLQAQVVARAAA